MNQVPEERKQALTKTFAIVGFIAIILFAVWAAVQIVSLMPSAFSSLASLADGVYNYEPTEEMQVTAGETVVNAGEPFTINWTTQSSEGLYTFRYECTDGVAVQVINVNKELVSAPCNRSIEVDSSGAADIIVDSEKQRFIDVPYSISFTDMDGAEVSAANQITIINASIPTTQLAEADDTEMEMTEPEPEVAGETTSTPTAPVTPTTPVTYGEPEVIEEIIYEIPTSNPNGVADLSVRLIGVGSVAGNQQFTQAATISTNQTGAFQFEVTNHGTKTSPSWTFIANLPGDIDYESAAQVPLKPNERALITLGFKGISKTGVETFGVSIATTEDLDTSNNRFSSAVNITN